MTKTVLPNETAAQLGFNVMVVLTHADLTDADTSQTIALLDVDPGDVVQDCAIKLKTPFEDTADAALVSTSITIGDGGDVDRFLAATELNDNGTEIDFAAAPNTTVRYAYTAADTIDLIATTTAAKTCLQHDAGELHVFFRIARLNALVPAID